MYIFNFARYRNYENCVFIFRNLGSRVVNDGGAEFLDVRCGQEQAAAQIVFGSIQPMDYCGGGNPDRPQGETHPTLDTLTWRTHLGGLVLYLVLRGASLKQPLDMPRQALFVRTRCG